MSEVINTETTAENEISNRVNPQITLKDVKREMRSITRRTYKINRPNIHIRDSYTNSMNIVLTRKEEIKKYFDNNIKNINDDELIKIYDYYVVDGKKAGDFFNATFVSIVISTINSISIGRVINSLIKHDFKKYDGLGADVFGAIIILFVSLLFAWFGVKSLNRDSYKYEIDEVNNCYDDILKKELKSRNKPALSLPSKWELKEYKKRNRFLFWLPLLPIRKIKGLISIILHPFSKLNRTISHYSVISKQIRKLETARKEAEHLDCNEKQIIINHINKKLAKEEKRLNIITGKNGVSSGGIHEGENKAD